MKQSILNTGNKQVSQISIYERKYLGKWMRYSLRGVIYRSLTNPVKTILGREEYNESYDDFLLRYIKNIFSFSRRPLDFKITSAPRSFEGPCSQALSAIGAINFANLSGINYVHSNFKDVAHADRSKKQWASDWENYFNLGTGESEFECGQDDVVNLSAAYENIQYVYHCYDICAFLPQTVQSIKRKYYLNKKRKKNRNSFLTICVHVRRGDVSNNSHEEYFTPSKVVKSCIEQLKSQLGTLLIPYQVHLFSQGNRCEFQEFEGLDIEFHLDKDPIWSHGQLVSADILLTAKSSYSYVAALLCDGIIIYEPNDIPLKPKPLDNWLIRSADGSYEATALEQQLHRHNLA